MTDVRPPTAPSDSAVADLIGTIESPRRRADTENVVSLIQEVTGQPPVLWGNIVGFGSYHYKYATGREGDSMVVGVAPRKVALTLYGLVLYEDEPLLEQLGEHSRGKGCVYIKNLERVDRAVLAQLVRQAWERSEAAGFQFDASAPAAVRD
jgi:Domain of unknown function (DU1801)